MLCCSGNGCSELAETMHYCIGILTVPVDIDSSCYGRNVDTGYGSILYASVSVNFI